MKNPEPMFNDHVRAFAILTHIATAHEKIVESITDMCKTSFLPLIHVMPDFIESLNIQSIPQRMNDNIDKAIKFQKELANIIENGNIQRKHYDLFVMDMLDVIRDVCAIGIDQANIIFDDFSIELSNTVDNVEEQGEEFVLLYDKALALAIELTKEYAIL
jgi:hypothetical protein